jgi:hypothetical protein
MRFPKFLDKFAFALVLILLALLPFHAFLYTWLHSFFWQQSFVVFFQAWKEILLAILGLLAFAKLLATHKIPQNKSFLFALLLITLASLYLLRDGIFAQKVYGLRNATMFLLAFIAMQLFDFREGKLKRVKHIVLFCGRIVILFALLQKFILPSDFLKHFGYSEVVSAWLPNGNLPMYHLVEGNEDLIRLQATFSGPNQLGSYLLVILPLAIYEFWERRRSKGWWKWFLFSLVVAGFLALTFTFSRSAWLGGVAILVFFAIREWRKNLPKKLKKKLLWGGILGVATLAILGFSQAEFREIFVRNSSTFAHFERSREAFEMMLTHPLGIGLGETAGVSQRFENPFTPENTYLSFALELGWLGGILFLAFLLTLLFETKKAKSPLFFSLLGIMIVMFFLHPLEDAPTALTLFLLLGMLNSPKLKKS